MGDARGGEERGGRGGGVRVADLDGISPSLGEDWGSHAVSRDGGNGNPDSEGREVEIYARAGARMPSLCRRHS